MFYVCAMFVALKGWIHLNLFIRGVSLDLLCQPAVQC